MGGKTSKKKEEMVEAYACKVNDMKDGEMREIDMGDAKALLVRDQGEYSAIGAKCTHYGAPLGKGALKNGRVRCPWHGACFDVKTGDLEDFPGLDCVHKHEVVIQNNDKVFIKASKSALISHKRNWPMVHTANKAGPHVLMIGGGITAVTCAETLRQKSFTGTITIATMEKHLPYDRTKLSKTMDIKVESIYLRPQQFYNSVNIKILLNKEAVQVDLEEQNVLFEDGEILKFDKLLLATGGHPRTMPIPGWDLKNVFVLRSPEDSHAISKQAKEHHVLICGASFIGMEIASALVGKAKSVSVCEFFNVPFERILGTEVGNFIKRLHEDRGVKFYLNASIAELQGDNGFVQRALLKDGSELKADMVIAGIGMIPATEFLRESNISLSRHGFVHVDRHMRVLHDGTKEPYENIFAGGDISMFPQKLRHWQLCNIQHWQMASYHGRVAATNMIESGSNMLTINSVPYFWTLQYGKSLRYAGYGVGYDDIVMLGDVSESMFCAYYTAGDEVIAAATLNYDPAASDLAQKLLAGEKVLKSTVEEIRDS